MIRILSALLVSILLTSCQNEKTPLVPLYEGLSKYHRSITTNSSEAQDYFDQGLALYYGYNHEAAILSFKQAIALDSNCVMAWWGQALASGPHINNPEMDDNAKTAAWETLQRAQDLKESASPVEYGLINALSKRYSWPPPENRKSLDVAYVNAMSETYSEFPEDPDVATLYADALMNLRPWDLWTSDGIPQPGTKEIMTTLESVLEKYPDHPGACHFYIHTMEASPFPEKALPAANNLRNKIPGAGHLVHMPSHIDIRLGNYEDAITANLKAIIADSIWISAGGLYTIYRAHNYHFLAYAAMFDGQKELALSASNGIIDQVPLELVRAHPDFLDGFLAVPTHVMIRFGMWEELIASPKPPDDIYLTTAFWHYGRTVAFAATGRVDEATEEYNALLNAYKLVPDSRLIGNNPGKTVLDIGVLMAKGELEYRKENYEEAFNLLREAVQKDDELRYDEPWGWMMPIRHSLGALLAEQGLYEEAEDVFNTDLLLHPHNGWALKGLATCYHMTGQHQKAKITEELFFESWSRSDIHLKAACFCSKGTTI
ncbi:MAG: tetratricopeptide repeat protein [Bacteroidota bacterium]